MEIQKKYIEVRGKKMAVIDEGVGEPIIFLHGNPTSSHLWRNIAPNFLNTNRIIVPDLIGMGDSEKLDGIILVGAAFKEDTDDLRNSPTTEIFNNLKSSIENVIIFDEIINNEDIVKFDYLESLNSSHLFVLMYPVKESTLDRLNKVIEETNSITYIPWSL